MKKCRCGRSSLRGLLGDNPPCQFHWNEANWGTPWATACENGTPVTPTGELGSPLSYVHDHPNRSCSDGLD